MEPIPFRTLLLIAGVLTRDGRMIEPGGVTWTTPITLMGQLTDSHGGDPGPTVPLGRIDTITQSGDEYWGEGFLTTDDGIYRAAPLIADLTLNGISCDLAPKVIEYREGTAVEAAETPVQQTPEEAANPQAEPVVEGVDRISISDFVTVYVETEIVAATMCAMPAIEGAFIELVTGQPVDPAAAIAASGEPCDCATRDVLRVLTAAAPVAPPEPAPTDGAAPAGNSTLAMIALYPPEAKGLAVDGGLAPEDLHITLAFLGDATAAQANVDELVSICTELAAGLDAGTGNVAGPAAFTNNDGDDPDDPAMGSDVPLVALIDSDWACDVWAALDEALDASGIDTPSEHGFIPHMTLQYASAAQLLEIPSTDLTFASIFLVIGTDVQEFPCGSSMTASAMGAAPEEPPASWFNEPDLDGPTPLTVDDEGRVFGHIAAWGTCHTAFAQECVLAPHSRSGYAYFHLGELVAQNGQRIPVGQITLDTTHADLAATRKDAQLHYEKTGNAVADVRAGEDEYGIWVAGAVRPETPAKQLRALRGAKISGDWRSVGGQLELIGALAVNIPGFPVPRTQARVASGVVTALVTGDIEAHDISWITDDNRLDALAAFTLHGDQAIDHITASLEEVA